MMVLDGQSRIGLTASVWSNAAESTYRRLTPKDPPPPDVEAPALVRSLLEEDHQDQAQGRSRKRTPTPPQGLSEQARRKLEALADALGKDLVLDPEATYQFVFNPKTGLIDLQQLGGAEPVVVLSLTLREISRVSDVMESTEGLLTDRLG